LTISTAVSRAFDESTDLERLLGAAGFQDMRTHVEHRNIVFASGDEWWEWKWSYSIRGVLEQLDASSQEAYRSAAYAAMQAIRGPDGFPMRLSACLVFGQKP